VLQTVIQLGEGATLEYLPDHVIPHMASLCGSLCAWKWRGEARAILWTLLPRAAWLAGNAGIFRRSILEWKSLFVANPPSSNRTKIQSRRPRTERLGLMEEFSYFRLPKFVRGRIRRLAASSSRDACGVGHHAAS